MKNKKYTCFIIFSSLFILIFLLVMVLSFNILRSDSPSINQSGGWQLQTNLQSQLRGRVVNDMTFIDSVTGFAVTNALTQTDTCFIFKTTNGGNNWFVNYWTNEQYSNSFRKIQFVTKNTGYICGGGGTALICKTTDEGNTWSKTNLPFTLYFSGISCLNKDTLFVVSGETLTGGVFRTTNGGQNWERLYWAGNDNPTDIYMYNARIGFYSRNTIDLYKTTNGGYNWFKLDSGFYQMYFLDSLTGYMAYKGMKKTTNGGYNWTKQILPNIPDGSTSKGMIRFQLMGTDTIWGIGGNVWYPNPGRYIGFIYKTTNGGLNWGYQFPDTHTVKVFRYYFINFYGSNYGWAYSDSGKGVHTTTGGDSTIYTNINENNFSISKDYILYQNYPNPFNSVSSIKYQVKRNANIKILVYNINGKELETLIDKRQSPGEYEIRFDARLGGYSIELSSGIYFYTLYADGLRIDTKKLILIK